MKTILTVTAIASIPLAALGAELRMQCPERYLTRVVKLAEVPQEWQGAIATVRPELLLSGGGMVGGPVELYPPADLRGSDVKSKVGWSETRYPVGSDGESWVYCAYGQGGEIQLFRRIDGTGVRECSVRTSLPKAPAPPVVEIVCR
ncbi:STY0301 family protein [Massilia endophytica]|uniref:STY0301 family protein n=1 Tax=Massilia endophytica TaxID=2899220 RepID=UPI0038995A77